MLPVVDTTKMHGLGLNFSYDKRGNYYYPKSGYLINLNYKTIPGLLGNEYVSNSIDFDANYYHGIRGLKDVIATRLVLGVGIGDLSFNQQYIVGRNDIRGYSKGAYRGNHMVALQSEYRWNFHERLGMVGFVGLATIFDGVNEDDNGRILPGVGTGVRFKVQKDTNFNVGIDAAKGVGDWSLSFTISEAF